MDSVREACRYRFGTFVLDPPPLELRRGGRPVRLRPQALKLLALLVSRPGQIISRDEIQAALWGSETFIDFEQGVNHCIKQLRAGLHDSAESPRFVETVPRRGYRFIAPVQAIRSTDAFSSAGRADAAQASDELTAGAAAVTVVAEQRRRRAGGLSAVALAGLAAALGIVVSTQYIPRPRSPAAATPLTIGVLPFGTTGTDPTLGVGLAHAISSRLAVQHLAAVRTPHATIGLPRHGTAVTDTGRAATSILTGALTQTGGTIAVVTELTDVATGSRTWSGRFRVASEELFSVENVIAARVVEALQLRLAATEQDRLRRRYTDNAAAYAAYLQGRAALVEYTPAGTQRAIAAFQAALQQNTGYALARAGLAMACADMYLRFAKSENAERWGACAEAEARTALDMDPDLAEAHLAKAMVARKREFDWGSAISSSQRALVLNPNLEQGHFITAAAYYHLGYMEEATIELQRGRRLRGLDAVEPIRIEALIALFSGNFAAAWPHLEEVSRRSSQAIGDTYLALAYYYSGNVARARPMLESLATSASSSTAARAAAALGSVLAALGEREEAAAVLDGVLTSRYRDHHVAYSLGAAYAQLGREDEAARWLRTAADTGFPCAPWFERDPLLDPIRHRPVFVSVMERVRVQRQAALSGVDAPVR